MHFVGTYLLFNTNVTYFQPQIYRIINECIVPNYYKPSIHIILIYLIDAHIFIPVCSILLQMNRLCFSFESLYCILDKYKIPHDAGSLKKTMAFPYP